jgi:hypothetical protein
MYEAFIDLDELIVRCRDKSSRKFIQEAVSCYKTGAFRSCIVSTWNAVVFDFLHKLRELELLGDKEALKLLGEFEVLRSSGNKFKELWQFESNISEIALTKFELLSNIEKSDIDRLFEDRSRCAHPSMTSLEEPFEATAELARYHLRSAVTHLLQRPPVQGRAARDRIFHDISSEYFPVDSELAIKYFEKSPLARARFLLIKDVIIGLTKDLLIEKREEDERARQFSAINAVSSMYPLETREILNDQLSNIIINRVTDENWGNSIIYLGTIKAWDELSERCKLKAEAFINKIDVFESQQNYSQKLSDQAIIILVKASRIDFLRGCVLNKFKIPLKFLLLLNGSCKDKFFKEMILIPALRDLSPEATLDELLLMRSEQLLKSDNIIKERITEKIINFSLDKLISIASNHQDEWTIDLVESRLKEEIIAANLNDLIRAKSKYKSTGKQRQQTIDVFNIYIEKRVKEEAEHISLENTYSLIYHHEDEYFSCLIEPLLTEKISTADLEDLLAAKSIYKNIDEKSKEISEAFDKFIQKRVKHSVFDELIDLRKYWDEIPNELIETVLKNNVLAIIDKFVESDSFYFADSNAILLLKISEHLDQTQWENILEAFLENDQLYGSYRCIEGFEALFKKSLEFHQSIQPCWLSFRGKLNKFNSKSINSLKRLIDSHM